MPYVLDHSACGASVAPTPTMCSALGFPYRNLPLASATTTPSLMLLNTVSMSSPW